MGDMPSESYINIGETDQKSVHELAFEPPKAESVGGERNLESKRYNLKEIFVSLSEAREKFGPILMHSKFSPKDLFCFKLKDLEFRKEIRRFETAEYQGFKRVLQDIEENVDFHDYLVSNGKFPDSETFREMILKAGMLDEGNIDGVMRRLEVFMKHSVDIDVFLLTVRNRMEAVAIRGGIKVEEVKKLLTH